METREREEVEKTEFPTFLNQQPTIIFGRTARELAIIACGLSACAMVWESLGALESTLAGNVLSAFLSLIPVIVSAIIAFATIGERPLEEWMFVLMAYALVPKLYLYQPLTAQEEERNADRQRTVEQARETNSQGEELLDDPY